jgi:signal transduction histidine kinase
MEKEVSCINSKIIIEYIRKTNPEHLSLILGDLDPELDNIDDPIAFLTDTNNWISTVVIVKMFDRVKSISHDDSVPYEIGTFAIENAHLGYIQKIFVKAFWSSKKALKFAQKINDKFNRNKRVELVEIKRNTAIVRLHWEKDMKPSKDLCLYNQAIYAYLHTIWGGRPLDIHEKYCFFEGSPYCEYHLKWTKKSWIYEYLSRFFTSRSMLKDIIADQEKNKEIIERKYAEINQLNLKLNRKIKQLMAVQDTGKAILSLLDLKYVLSAIMNILSNVCQISRAVIMLVSEDGESLEYLHGTGLNGVIPDEIKNYHIPMTRVSNILARVANTGIPEYIPDVNSSNLQQKNIILSYGKPASVYVAPLITRSKVIGVIATDSTGEKGVSEETRETLDIFTPQIAIAIENAKLYTKLQVRMKELTESHALLSRAEKFSFLGNLAARLAHEIKNPMTAIGTFMQMLPQKYGDDEFRNDFYKIVMEETNRVNNLITELLDLVKEKEPCFEFNDIHDLINKMILLVSPQSKAKGIKIISRFHPDIGQVWIDSEKMKQVILNLISNALDFTPHGGIIEVTTSIGPDKGGKKLINIEVKDNGVGIPQSMIEKVFEPFFTTKHKSSIHNGTGLGLFIAYQNMQLHNGTIVAKSDPDKKGTTFILTLPVYLSSNQISKDTIQ